MDQSLNASVNDKIFSDELFRRRIISVGSVDNVNTNCDSSDNIKRRFNLFVRPRQISMVSFSFFAKSKERQGGEIDSRREGERENIRFT